MDLLNIILNGDFPYSTFAPHHLSLIPKVFPVNKMSEYRCITVGPRLALLFTNILHNKLFHHLHSLGKLSLYQFGFTANQSTSTANLVLKTIQEKYVVSLRQPLFVAYVDFQSAFDKVNRKLLF